MEKFEFPLIGIVVIENTDIIITSENSFGIYLAGEEDITW